MSRRKCCCAGPGEFCNEFYSAPNFPFELWVDVPALADDNCTECAAIEGTYRVDFVPGSTITNCRWGIDSSFDLSCGDESEMQVTFVNGVLQFQITFQFGFPPTETSFSRWSITLSSSTAVIDHVVDFTTDSNQPDCDGTETTVRIYEADRVDCTVAGLIITGLQATIE